MRVQIACCSNIGKVRKHNEDYIVGDESLQLVVLADGMGGCQAGEVASKIAAETVYAEMSTQLQKQSGLDNRVVGKGYHHTTILLEQAILKANSVVYETANQQMHFQGMGTTMVAALFNEDFISVAHIGDSRLYRLRGNELKVITTDHSVLQELIDCGFITPDQARTHPNRNLVTRALGIGKNVTVDIQEYKIQAEDLYLLCSDGLSDMLDNKDIQQILLEKKDASLDEISNSLVNAANEKGGADNISVVVTRFLQVLNKSRFHWLKKLFYWKL
jgi:serine/threonine protein phosphatase PrpC